MERARLRSIHLRPRRAPATRTIDLRLARAVSVLLLVPIAVLALALSRPAVLPAPPLPPAFDGATAAALARELAQEHPVRTPGSPGAEGARRWLRARLAPYGLGVEEDTWEEDVPGLGPTALTNVSVVVPGTLDDTLVFVAHLDNDTGGGRDNATGAAALLELARGFAAGGTAGARPRRPLHRLVFLWTDGGAHGSLGALRFADRDRRAVAAIVLDGVGGAVTTRIGFVGARRTTASAPFVRTVVARIAAETGAEPDLVGVPSQLVALGVPAATGEHAALLGEGITALGISTGREGRSPAGADIPVVVDDAFGRLGAGIDTALGTLDASVQLPRGTRAELQIGERVVPGWAVQALLLAMLAPSLVAVIDLHARTRRRGIAAGPAWRELRRRAWPWLGTAAATGVGAFAGELPVPDTVVPTPSLAGIAQLPVVALALAGLVWIVALALGRRRPTGPQPASESERVAGWVAALLALSASALLTAAASPFALVFVLPSLGAWTILAALPNARPWLSDLLLGIGWAAPAVAVAILAVDNELGLRVPLYLAAQLTSGAVPWIAVGAGILWAAAAGQIAALARGSYAPSVSRR